MNGSDTPLPRPRRRLLARIADAIAIALIVLAIWRLFVAQHFFGTPFTPVPAPPVSLHLMDGGSFDVAKARGNVVFLDFWASWCTPCKLSIPLIERYKTEHPQALVYSVDAGEKADVAEKYARNAKMQRVALDPDMDVANAFGVSVFPTMVVIGRDGKVRAKWVGFNPLIGRDMARVAAQF